MFVLNVLSHRGQRCVFCELNPSAFGARHMLVAGHIKPREDSAPSEHLDPRNGLAACPSHDVAFDTGLLTIGPALQIHVSEALANAGRDDPLTRQYYGRPPLLETLPPRYSSRRRRLENQWVGLLPVRLGTGGS